MVSGMGKLRQSFIEWSGGGRNGCGEAFWVGKGICAFHVTHE